MNELNKLINDVLDVNKLELGKLRLDKSEIDVDDFLTQKIKELNYLTVEKNISMTKEIKGNWKIYCDNSRIFQIISNLARNAVDFIPEKNGKITIRAEKHKDETVFTVYDNGIGISPDKADDLFQKFYQVDSSFTRKHGGTGLGLVICKGIVEAHGGKMWFDKSYTSGASFKFTMPRKGKQ